MRFLMPLTIAAVAALGLSGAASAKDMNDTTFIAVAHCAGVAEGTGGDVSSFDTVLNAQSGSRSADVMDRADQARSDGKRDAAHSGPDGKAGFVRERDGVCQSYVQRG